MTDKVISANDLARAAGVDQKLFRDRLRQARLSWHVLNERWTVPKDSPQHLDMRRVLERLIR